MYHTWQEKDNLLIVTNQYKVTVERLKRLNPKVKDWNAVKDGTKIRIK